MKSIIRHSWLIKPTKRIWVNKEQPDLCFPIPTSEPISPKDEYLELLKKFHIK